MCECIVVKVLRLTLEIILLIKDRVYHGDSKVVVGINHTGNTICSTCDSYAEMVKMF